MSVSPCVAVLFPPIGRIVSRRLGSSPTGGPNAAPMRLMRALSVAMRRPSPRAVWSCQGLVGAFVRRPR